jgi:hypothetical protein
MDSIVLTFSRLKVLTYLVEYEMIASENDIAL